MKQIVSKSLGCDFSYSVYFCTNLETDRLYELIEERRKELGLSQAQVGLLAVGQENSSVIQAIRRGSSPTAKKLNDICVALGFEFYVGPRRVVAAPAENVAGESEFVKVARHSVSLSAGPGLNGLDSAELAPIAFRTAWMRDRNLTPQDCAVLGIVGDSMEPTLRDGDLVLIDRTKRKPINMALYAFVDTTGDARVKRFEIGEGAVILRSDNPDRPSEIRMADDANAMTIIGRVVWAGHEFK